jgi:hypothetical protein
MTGRVRFFVACAVLLASVSASAVNPPTRYIPAPKDRAYLLVYLNALPVGSFSASDSDVTNSGAPGGGGTTKIKWTEERYELGASLGYGFGPLGFIRGSEAALSVPFSIRSVKYGSYLYDDTGLFDDSLHTNIKDKKTGSALSDIQASLLGLLYADASGGTWLSSAIKVALPTGTSAAKQYTLLLHGVDTGGPADGAGVTRITPALNVVKSIARQRLYVNLEYGIPIGSEKFTINTAEMKDKRGTSDTWDSKKEFTEEFTPGSILAGTLGLETNLNILGIAPGLEITFRQYGKTGWKENGEDGLKPPAGEPVYTPEFLNSSGWVMGNIPFKATTEIEMALTGSLKLKANDAMKAGIVYVWNPYGSMIGAKMTFTNLFDSMSEEEMLRRSGPGAKAMEMNVSPMIDAPAPPSGRILTGVAMPVAGTGVTEETVQWLTKELRNQMDKLGSYSVMSPGDMAQLADSPCAGADCGTRFGRALRQQAMVVSRIEKAGAAGYEITVKMVDVGAGTVSSSASLSEANLDAVRKAIPDLLKRLTAPAEAPAQKGGDAR